MVVNRSTLTEHDAKFQNLTKAIDLTGVGKDSSSEGVTSLIICVLEYYYYVSSNGHHIIKLQPIHEG
jgi:hypothetical protein